jgi:hypothetical protein
VRDMFRRQRRLAVASAIVACIATTAAITVAVTRRGVAAVAPTPRPWDDETRAAVRHAFMQSGDPAAAAAFDEVDARLKKYLAPRR